MLSENPQTHGANERQKQKQSRSSGKRIEEGQASGKRSPPADDEDKKIKHGYFLSRRRCCRP
jgi:hypothetical protein